VYHGARHRRGLSFLCAPDGTLRQDAPPGARRAPTEAFGHSAFRLDFVFRDGLASRSAATSSGDAARGALSACRSAARVRPEHRVPLVTTPCGRATSTR
jgi:hypothetical protein